MSTHQSLLDDIKKLENFIIDNKVESYFLVVVAPPQEEETTKVMSLYNGDSGKYAKLVGIVSTFLLNLQILILGQTEYRVEDKQTPKVKQ